jgi:hypothetical protein
MNDEVGGIEIAPCPRCGEGHRYALNVVRSTVSQFMSDGNGDTPKEKSFVRLFVCPTNNENFQATVSLTVPAGSRIKDVEVVSVEDSYDG